jgi:hypothetical protein
MNTANIRWKAVLATLLLLGTGSASLAQDLNQKVVRYCEQNLGRQVGDGECAALAAAALRSAGAIVRLRDHPNPGDYVWGRFIMDCEAAGGGQVGSGTGDNVRPGDVIQFRNAVFRGRTSTGTYTSTARHHTAVVYRVSNDDMVFTVLHQNSGGRRYVTTKTFNLHDLKEGWVRIYRPLPANR